MPIIGQVVNSTDHLITGIPRFDQPLHHIPHIHHWHNIFASANDKTLPGLNKIDKATKACDVSWPIHPCRAHNNDWSSVLFHEIGNQLLTSNLRTTIGVVFSAIGITLGHDTLEMVSIDRNGTGMDNALHACIHRCMNQVSQSLHIDSSIDLFQSPRTRFCSNIVDTLHTLHSAFERRCIRQITVHDLNTCPQVTCISIRPHQRTHFITTLY